MIRWLVSTAVQSRGPCLGWLCLPGKHGRTSGPLPRGWRSGPQQRRGVRSHV